MPYDGYWIFFAANTAQQNFFEICSFLKWYRFKPTHFVFLEKRFIMFLMIAKILGYCR